MARVSFMMAGRVVDAELVSRNDKTVWVQVAYKYERLHWRLREMNTEEQFRWHKTQTILAKNKKYKVPTSAPKMRQPHVVLFEGTQLIKRHIQKHSVKFL
jgi:hypothetical protein